MTLAKAGLCSVLGNSPSRTGMVLGDAEPGSLAFPLDAVVLGFLLLSQS